MQETLARSLVQEGTHAVRQLSPHATTPEPGLSAHAPQREEPPQGEVRARQPEKACVQQHHPALAKIAK